MAGNALAMKVAQGIAITTENDIINVQVDNTAKTLAELLDTESSSVPDDAVAARLYFEGDNIRMIENGTPTDSTGFIMSNGNIYDLDIRVNIDNAKFILDNGASSAGINIQFYK